MINKYYSITLFAYKRPFHTYKTLKALANNPESIHSNLNVFIDGPKNNYERDKINSTLKIIEDFKDRFKKLVINKSYENKGLSKSIIEGVSHVLNNESATIILEDDIVTSKNFLSYMNQSIEFFRSNSNLWHISAYNYPINEKINTETFFWRVMHCWGWATWNDRWELFRENQLSMDPFYLKDIFSKSMINRFNLEGRGENWWDQVELNANNKIDSWAIFWYAHIFLNNGLCLNPKKSLVQNIGLDGSGTFTNKQNNIKVDFSNKKELFIFPECFKEDQETVKKIKRYFFKLRIKKLLSKFIKVNSFLTKKLFNIL